MPILLLQVRDCLTVTGTERYVPCLRTALSSQLMACLIHASCVPLHRCAWVSSALAVLFVRCMTLLPSAQLRVKPQATLNPHIEHAVTYYDLNVH